jgi:cytochrome c553
VIATSATRRQTVSPTRATLPRRKIRIVWLFAAVCSFATIAAGQTPAVANQCAERQPHVTHIRSHDGDRRRNAFTRIAYTKASSRDSASPGVRSGDLAAGRALYLANCSACHGAGGEGNAVGYGTRAPDLKSTSLAAIAPTIRLGPGVMPKFDAHTLSDANVGDITRYIGFLQTGSSNFGGLALFDIGTVAEGAVAIIMGLGSLVVVTRLIGSND